MESIKQQLIGAFKTVNILAMVLALFLVWVIKDQRHVSLTILDSGCNLYPITDEQQRAYNQFPPR